MTTGNIQLTLKATAVLAWSLWVAVGIEVLIVDMLELKAFLSLVAASAAVSVIASIRCHADKMVAITLDHAKLIKEHLALLDKAFQLGLQGDATARRDAHMSDWGTGEFKVYRGGIGS